MSERNNNQLFECYFIDSNEKRKIKWNYNMMVPVELHGFFPEANGKVVIEKESDKGMITAESVFQHGKTYIVPVPDMFGSTTIRDDLTTIRNDLTTIRNNLNIPELIPHQ